MPICDACQSSIKLSVSCPAGHRACLSCARDEAETSFELGSTSLPCPQYKCKASFGRAAEGQFMTPALIRQRKQVKKQVPAKRSGPAPTHKTVLKPVKEKRDLGALHELEEELTAALMRKCPGCRKPFVRTEGCPEMTCTSCGILFCYLCAAAPRPRNHFHGGSCYGDSGAEEVMRANVKKIWKAGVARMTSALDKAAAQKLKPFA